MRIKISVLCILSISYLGIYADFLSEDVAVQAIYDAIIAAAKDETKLNDLEKVYREAIKQYPKIESRSNVNAMIDYIAYLKQMRGLNFENMTLPQVLNGIEAVADVISARGGRPGRTNPANEIFDRATSLLTQALNRLQQEIIANSLDYLQLQEIKKTLAATADAISMKSGAQDVFALLETTQKMLDIAISQRYAPSLPPSWQTAKPSSIPYAPPQMQQPLPSPSAPPASQMVPEEPSFTEPSFVVSPQPQYIPGSVTPPSLPPRPTLAPARSATMADLNARLMQLQQLVQMLRASMPS